MKINLKKLISGLTAALYLFSVMPASYAAPETTVELQEGQPVPVKPAGEPSDSLSETSSPSVPEDSSTDFLIDNPLSAPQEDETGEYAYERYDFDYAVELLQPGTASAVIVESLTQENLAQLLELPFETGIAVLHGEIVLFTTGNEEEIGVTPAAKKLLDEVSFVAHTHVAAGAQDGPSSFDLDHAVSNIEYVLTQKGIYAYSQDGLAGTPSSAEFLTALKADQDQEAADQVQARAALNEFIAEMDRTNEASPEEREIYRKSAALLNSITAVINGGATHTNNANVTIAITVGDTIPQGEQLQMAFSQDGTNFSAFENLTSAKNLALTGADGSKTLHIRFKDNAGNLRTVQKNIILDRDAPDFAEEYVPDTFNFQTASNGARDNFGISMTQVGNVIAIGDSQRHLGSNVFEGAVDLYDATGKLLKSIPSPNFNKSEFGRAVASYKDKYLIVGAPSRYTTGGSGVFLIDADPASPTFGNVLKSFTNPDNGSEDAFGQSLLVVGDRLFVGAPDQTVNGWGSAGKIYIFDINPQSGQYGSHLGTIQSPAPAISQYFGQNMAMYEDGTHLAVGTSNKVYVYSIFGSLIEDIDAPAGSIGFGSAIARDGNLLYVGAYQTSGGPGLGFAGKVYVFNAEYGSPQYGQLVTTLSPAVPQERGHFGQSLKIFDHKLYVGAPGYDISNITRTGSIDIFYIDPARSEFGQLHQHLAGTDSYFGLTMLPQQGLMYVGVPLIDTLSTASGGTALKYKIQERTTGIVVNGGKGMINSLTVPLTLDIYDEISQSSNLEMAFSENGTTFTSYEVFNKNKNLTITNSADGTRNIWVRVRDQAGNAATFQQSFILDRTAPVPVAGKNVFGIENGTNATNKTAPNLNVEIQDAFSSSAQLEMAFSQDGTNFTNFSAYTPQSVSPITFSSPNGTKTLYVKFRDAAGNVTQVYSDTIIFDASAPTLSSVSINSGAANTANLNAQLTLNASDATTSVTEMRYLVKPTGNTLDTTQLSAWEPYSATKAIELISFVGSVEVVVQVRDAVGNVSAFVSDTITITAALQSGDLTYLSQGLYQLSLDQDFKNYLAKVMPANLVSSLSVDDKAFLELQAMKEYARQNLADVYDFVVLLPTHRAASDNLPFYSQYYLNQILGLGWAEVDNIAGIGMQQPTPDQIARMVPFESLFKQELGPVISQLRESSPYQSTALLDVQLALDEIGENGFVDYVLLHELHHRWGTFLSSKGNFNSNPLGILGRDHAHWNMFFDGNLSPMDALNWVDNGNGTFTLTHIQGISVSHIIQYNKGLRSDLPVTYQYNDFDLYAMGLVDKSAVASSFMIENPRTLTGEVLTTDNLLQKLFNDPFFLNGEHTITGTRRTVTIQDVINIEGNRDPLAANSQKNFNVAFVYVRDDTNESSSNDFTQAQNRWKDTIDDIWKTATRSLSTMSLGFSNAAFTVFQNKVLGLFESVAGTGNSDSKEVEEAEDHLDTMSAMDALIAQIESLVAGLQAKVNTNSLIPSFIGTIPSDVAAFKTQIQNFRNQLQTALDNAAGSDAFISGKRTSLINLILQSAITGLLPAGFGSSVDAIIQSVKGLFTGVATANSAFNGSSASILSQLNAFKTKLEGPVTGHKFEVLGNAKSTEVDEETLGQYDGAGDSIVVENSDDWNLGTGDFTVDFRLKMNSHSGEKYLFQIGNGLYLSWHPVNGGRLDLIAGGAVISTNYKNDTNWHHFAVVRSGGTLKLYVDGVQKDQGVNANKSISSGKFTIGSENSGIMSVDGFFDDFRVTKGKALWTSNFTAPEDVEREAETKLLLNFTPEEFEAKAEVGTSTGPKPIKGTAAILNGNTHTGTTSITLNLTSSAGAPPIQMAFSLDGGSTYSSYESFASTKNLTLTGADGTKEVRVRYKDSANQTLDLSDTIILDRAQPTGSVSVNAGAATATASGVTLTLDADDALTSDSNLQMSISVDGTNFSAYESFKTSKSVTLTGDSGVKTVTVRYKDEAGNIHTVTDTIQYDKPAVVFTGKTFTVMGNAAVVEKDSVFGGTSGEWDGAGDNVTVQDSVDWNLGTGDFTIDFRLKMETHNGEKYLFQIGNGLYLSWHPVNGGRLDLIAAGSVISTAYKNDGGWHHFAVVRQNGTLKLYVDGVQKDIGVNANKAIPAGKFTIGSESSGVMSVDGFFDEFRLSNTARWTSNFTAPTGEYDRDDNTKFLLHFNAEEWAAKAETGGSSPTPQPTPTPAPSAAPEPSPSPSSTPAPAAVTGTASILNGNSHTTAASITINLSASGGTSPYQMAFSLDGGSTYSSYESFASTKNLTLTGADGTKEVRVRYKDNASQTLDVSDTIILDRAQPTGSVSVNAGAAKSTSLNVTLTLDADDALTSDANLQMSISVDGTNFSAYESFQTTKSVTLLGDSGIKTVTVRYKDQAGNVREVTDTIEYEKPAVVFAGKTFTVTGNAAVVEKDSVFGGSSGEWDGAGDNVAVQDSPDWNLGTGDFTIDFRLKMETHNGEKYLFQIGNGLYLSWHPVNGGRLDLIAAGSVISTAYKNDGGWHHFAVVRQNGTLKLYVDGVQKDIGVNANKAIPAGKFTIGSESSGVMSVDGFFDEFRLSNTARWTSNFTPEGGEYGRDENTKFLLHFNAEEFAGKSEVEGATGPKPVKGTASILNGNSHTTTASITLNLSVSDGTSPYQMAFSLDGGSTYSSYESFASTKNLTLTGADGTKEVRVRYKDSLGEVLETSDTIILDRAQPTGSVSINSGAAKATSAGVTLTLDADDALTSDANLQMSISVDGTNFSAYESFQTTKSVTLLGDSGIKTVTVRYKDEAGNIRTVTDTIEYEKPAVVFTGKTFAVNGNTAVTSTDSVFGDSSGDFDGAGDSIAVQDSPDWNLGTGDFTIDFRLKMDSHGGEKYLFQIGNGLYLSWHPVNGGRLDLIAAGSVISTAYKNDGNWHHFAVVRNNGTLKLYVDGAQKDIGVNANKAIPAGKFTIGSENSGVMSVDGKYDEFRLSNTARWTSNFTPEAGEYERDENTKFLLHFSAEEFAGKSEVEGVTGPKPVKGTAFIENNKTHTNTTSITMNLDASGGTAPIQMAFSLDGGATYTSYESIAAAKSLTLTGADGTKEVRVRYKDSLGEVLETSDTIILDRAQPTGSVSINSGVAKATSAGVTLTLDADDALTSDANLQMSISVDGTNFSAYESFQTSKNVTLLGDSGIKTVTVRYKDQAGNVREVTDTIEYEKPAVVFTGKTFAVNGNTAVTNADSVFGGSSGDFDGAGDSIAVQDSVDWNLGTGDFTIDFRLKMDSHNGEKYLFQIGNGLYLSWHPVNGGRLDLIGAGSVDSVALKPALGSWYHFAVVRTNGMIKLFVNGAQVVEIPASKAIPAGKFTIGAENSGVMSVDGKFDEFRVSKTARWTSNFTPPAGEYARDSDTALLLHFNSSEFAAKAETE